MKYISYICKMIFLFIIFVNNEGSEIDRLIGEQKEDKIFELIDKYRGM